VRNKKEICKVDKKVSHQSEEKKNYVSFLGDLSSLGDYRDNDDDEKVANWINKCRNIFPLCIDTQRAHCNCRNIYICDTDQ
jgi:hypothetical protein